MSDNDRVAGSISGNPAGCISNRLQTWEMPKSSAQTQTKARTEAAQAAEKAQGLEQFQGWRRYLRDRQTALGNSTISVTLQNNRSAGIVRFAIGFHLPDNRWMTMGWYGGGPGETITTDVVTTNPNLYFFGGVLGDSIEYTAKSLGEKEYLCRVGHNLFAFVDGEIPYGLWQSDVSFFHRRATSNQFLLNIT